MKTQRIDDLNEYLRRRKPYYYTAAAIITIGIFFLCNLIVHYTLKFYGLN